MQPFFAASVTVDGVKYQGATWDNVRFSLQKTEGGDKKTEGEYLDLIRGWDPWPEFIFYGPQGFGFEKDFVDMELFTLAEVLEMKEYFLGGHKNIRFSAWLFLDYPLSNKSTKAITLGRGRDFFKIYTRPGYPLRFKLVGKCDLGDGQAMRRDPTSDLKPGEISF